MPKQKTSFMVDPELWKQWTIFVVNKTGSARKLSDEVENALREYMARHKK